MYKCSALLFLFMLFSACTGPGRSSATLIDVQKVCSEPIPLVMKIAAIKQTDFRMQKSLDLQPSHEQIWDMKEKRTSAYGLGWMQLRFQHDRLQAVWFGPRTNLDGDLKTIGLKKSLLRNKKNRALKDFSKGLFYLKDLNNRKIRVERMPGGQKGVTVTCFPPKRF